MKKYRIGAFISYITIAFNIVSGIVYTPWVLKTIGDEDYAVFTVATSIISMFMVDFGIGTAVAKYVSSYYVKKEYEKINDFLGIIYKLYMAIDVFIVLALVILYLNINAVYKSFDADSISKLKTVFLVVGAYSVIQFPFLNLSGVLNSFERFTVAKGIDLFQKVTIVGVMIITLLKGGGLFELVIVNAVISLLAVFFKWIYLHYIVGVHANLKYWDKQLVKNIFLFSIWIAIITIMQRLLYSVAPTLISKFGTTSGITIFSFASAIEGYFFLIGNAISGMYMSKVTGITEANNSKELNCLLVRMGRFQLMLVGLVYVGWVCIGDLFVTKIWLGESYIDVYLAGIILMFPDLLIIPQQIASTAVVTKGLVAHQAIAYIISALTNIVFAYFLIPINDVIGMSVSISIAYTVYFVYMNVIFSKKMGLDMLVFYKKVYFSIIPFQGGIVALFLIVKRFLCVEKRIVIVGMGLIVTIIYMATMLLFVTNDEEKRLLNVRRKK